MSGRNLPNKRSFTDHLDLGFTPDDDPRIPDVTYPFGGEEHSGNQDPVAIAEETKVCEAPYPQRHRIPILRYTPGVSYINLFYRTN